MSRRSLVRSRKRKRNSSESEFEEPETALVEASTSSYELRDKATSPAYSEGGGGSTGRKKGTRKKKKPKLDDSAREKLDRHTGKGKAPAHSWSLTDSLSLSLSLSHTHTHALLFNTANTIFLKIVKVENANCPILESLDTIEIKESLLKRVLFILSTRENPRQCIQFPSLDLVGHQITVWLS